VTAAADRRNGREPAFPSISNAWTMPIKTAVDVVFGCLARPEFLSHLRYELR
jgi:hypothetical protein